MGLLKGIRQVGRLLMESKKEWVPIGNMQIEGSSISIGECEGAD